MLSLLLRRERKADSKGAAPTKGLLSPATVDELLNTPRRQRLLEHIWQRTSLSRAQFAELYRGPLERYATLVQLFPASAAHHHAYPGGMLDHGLEIVAYALKLRQSRLLPIGAPPETQAAQADAWSAAAAYAALLHDIGKMAVNFDVEYADGRRWHPWHGPLTREYRFRHRKTLEYRLHEAAAGLLYTRILDPVIFDWLNGYPELWSSLLYVLSGQHDRAGVLGELVTAADQASVAQDLGGDPTSAREAPKHALQRKLLDGLRYLVKEELKLNQLQASDGWLTDDSLWLVAKTVCDKLRAHLLSHAIDGIPDRNPAVFDVLQNHGIVQPTAEGAAIWKATVTSGSGWSHSLTFLRLAPSMIWGNDERPPSFNGTVRAEVTSPINESPVAALSPAISGPSIPITDAPQPADPPAAASPAVDPLDSMLALFEERTEGAPGWATPVAERSAPQMPTNTSLKTEAEGAIVDAPDAMQAPGEHFMHWLRDRILKRHLIINDAKALIHVVDGTAFIVSPGIFQRYAMEHPHVAQRARRDNLTEWQWVQKRFEKLKLHRKQNNGLNIWICEVKGSRRTGTLYGHLLKDGMTLFSDMPLDNPHLRLANVSDAEKCPRQASS